MAAVVDSDAAAADSSYAELTKYAISKLAPCQLLWHLTFE